MQLLSVTSENEKIFFNFVMILAIYVQRIAQKLHRS